MLDGGDDDGDGGDDDDDDDDIGETVLYEYLAKTTSLSPTSSFSKMCRHMRKGVLLLGYKILLDNSLGTIVSIHTYIRAYMHTCIHTYIHTNMHTCIHTYIHTYTHTYIYTLIHSLTFPTHTSLIRGEGTALLFANIRRGAVKTNGPRPALSRCALTMSYPAATHGRMYVAKIRQTTHAAPVG